MDNPQNNKKWMLFLENKQVGPFTTTEIKEKLTGGIITPSHLIWRNGMKEWVPISKIARFHEVASSLIANQAAPPTPTPPPSEISIDPDQTEPSIAAFQIPESEIKTGDNVIDIGPESDFKVNDPRIKLPTFADERPQWKIYLEEYGRVYLRKIGLILLVTFPFWGYAIGVFDPFLRVTGLNKSIAPISFKVRAKIVPLIQGVPLLGGFFNILSDIPGITDEQLNVLETAARKDLETSGPQIAHVLTALKQGWPKLVVATNLPDGAAFHAHAYKAFITGKTKGPYKWVGSKTLKTELRFASSDKIIKTDDPDLFTRPVSFKVIITEAPEAHQKPDLIPLMTKTPTKNRKLPDGNFYKTRFFQESEVTIDFTKMTGKKK